MEQHNPTSRERQPPARQAGPRRLEQDGQDDRRRDARRAFRIRSTSKIVRKSTRFKAHDEKNEAKIGDIVRIMECRPLSRDKRWRLVEIVERAKNDSARNTAQSRRQLGRSRTAVHPRHAAAAVISTRTSATSSWARSRAPFPVRPSRRAKSSRRSSCARRADAPPRRFGRSSSTTTPA